MNNPNEVFKSANTSATLKVMGINDGRTSFSLQHKGEFPTVINIANSDIPQLAFVAMQKAGYKDEERNDSDLVKSYFAWAMHYLQCGIDIQAKNKAEAKARKELDVEAFKLYRAYMAVHEPMNAIGDWQMLAEITKEKWLAVARKSREIGAGK